MSVQIIQGDCRDVLANLMAESVHVVVTSPPYWGLRDYGIPPSIWGGDAACAHEFAMETKTGELRTGLGLAALGEQYRGGGKKAGSIPSISVQHGFCRCGAWSGALGLEPTYQLYVEHMVEVFRAVRRVLRADGTLWLNIGDSYVVGGGHSPNAPSSSYSKSGLYGKALRSGGLPVGSGLKPKDLCGIPWRVALALQGDGWYLRQDIIWSKPNPMPESVTDRCSKAHEYLFLLSKSARYYFGADAIKEPTLSLDDSHPSYRPNSLRISREGRKEFYGKHEISARMYSESGRNKRSVWTIATSPFPEAHFATFPPALIEPCILAGSSERGCCAKCGAPWLQEFRKGNLVPTGKNYNKRAYGVVIDNPDDNDQGRNRARDGHRANMAYEKTPIGWRPICKCTATIQLCSGETDIVTYPVVPCTVLDPFGGAGTTGLVADRLQRNAILVELNQAYVDMARRRLFDDAPLLNKEAAE